MSLSYRDLHTLAALVERGADLSRPRRVVFYAYFPGHAGAARAARDARAEGFSTEVREPLRRRGQWLLVSELASAVVDAPFVRDRRDFFRGLADRFGGEYDGWDASV